MQHSTNRGIALSELSRYLRLLTVLYSLAMLTESLLDSCRLRLSLLDWLRVRLNCQSTTMKSPNSVSSNSRFHSDKKTTAYSNREESEAASILFKENFFSSYESSTVYKSFHFLERTKFYDYLALQEITSFQNDSMEKDFGSKANCLTNADYRIYSKLQRWFKIHELNFQFVVPTRTSN